MAEIGAGSTATMEVSLDELEDSVSSIHPQAAEILRQVEYYFGDENLCRDAFLLGRFKVGEGSVSLDRIWGFKAMRQYKPKSMVREALRQSKLVVVSQDGKRLSRRYPLDPTKIRVVPRIEEDAKKIVVPKEKPWLTKGMLKPTGFEKYHTDGPIKPEEYAEDRNEYDPEIIFSARIETAIMHFCARRKMHQTTRSIFDKFMVFGGMDTNQRQFMGGMSEKTMEDYTKKEIAELTSYYGVSECVLDAVEQEQNDPSTPSPWRVDFEAVAKAFLSSEFLSDFDWCDRDLVKTAANVLRNFYSYLLLHDVCPEYKDQLIAARKVCDLAEHELPRLKEVDQGLPGGFNVACSTLFGGNYVNLHASEGDWVVPGDDLGWSTREANTIFAANIFAHGTTKQVLDFENSGEPSKSFKVVYSEEIGLEITGIELADGRACDIYTSPIFANTFVKPMGKLYCKRWNPPHAAPEDLPEWMKDEQSTTAFEFLVEEATLKSCVQGMKMECCVKGLDIGIKWIDFVQTMYPSFYVWLPNKQVRERKKSGPPRDWMLRANGINSTEGHAIENREVESAMDAVDEAPADSAEDL